MSELPESADSAAQTGPAFATWFRQQLPDAATLRDFSILLVVTTFLLLYGLVPIFGGDQLGLVGADEPRYAQVAREMLEAHSDVCHEADAKMVPHSLHLADIRSSIRCIAGGTITPLLYGKPWLENPRSTTGAP